MNQDYLWSKKGGDAEVEELERLVSEFRFDGNSAPAFPTTNSIPVISGSKRRFVLGLSFAAIAAALVVAIWITRAPIASIATRDQIPRSVPETAQTSDDRVLSQVADSGKDGIRTAEPAKVSRPKTRHAGSKVNSRSPVIKAEKTALTKEEKYAYDRLMLALSIAGSKLKVVQDTIDRKGDTAPQSIRNEK